MIEGPLADEIRAASHFGCRALEALVLAIGHALERRLKPADQSMLRRKCDELGSRLVVWRMLVSNEPQIVTELETLTKKLQELQPRATR